MEIGVTLGSEGGERGDELPSTRDVFDGALLTVVDFVNDDEVDAFTLNKRSYPLRGGWLLECFVVEDQVAHKTERVRELIEARGCELLYLPPYSPDFNPIEEAFSKIKGILRKAEARTREGLVEALGAAISSVSARDAQGFFEHCRYGTSVRSLWLTL